MDARMLQDVWRFKFGCDWRMGDSSLVVIGESSFKIGLYFIHYDLQTLYTSKRILIKKFP